MTRITRAIALTSAIAITALVFKALDVGMHDAAERAQLDNMEPVRIVITAPRNDGQVAATASGFTF
jgi:hypothetical protein